jgi:hypothetical protein
MKLGVLGIVTMYSLVPAFIIIWSCVNCALLLLQTPDLEDTGNITSRSAPVPLDFLAYSSRRDDKQSEAPISAEPAEISESHSRDPISVLIVGQKTRSPRVTDTLEVAHEEKLETVEERVRLREMEDHYFTKKAGYFAKRIAGAQTGSVIEIAVATTGAEFLSILVSASIEREIGSIIVFGHSGTDGLYMLEDRGFYKDMTNVARNSSVVGGRFDERKDKLRALGARDLDDLGNLLRLGQIRFTNSAVIVFTGCSGAGLTEIDPSGFAATTSEITGATVFGSVNVTDDSVAAASEPLWAKEYSTGTWVQFMRGHRFEDLNTKTFDLLKQLHVR